MRSICRRLSIIIALIFLDAAPSAAEANDAFDDYSHTHLAAVDGAPAGIIGLAQTADGWLWCATADSLYRFDGVRFERYRPLQSPGFEGDRIHFIKAVTNGDLYIGFARAGLVVLHPNGQVVRLPLPTSHSLIRAVVVDQHGSPWIVDNGIQRFEQGRWQPVRTVGDSWHSSGAVSMLIDSLDQIWVGNSAGAWRLDQRADQFVKVSERAGELLNAPDGSVWKVADRMAAYQLTVPTGGRVKFHPERMGNSAAMFASDGTLWLPNCPTLICRGRPKVQLTRQDLSTNRAAFIAPLKLPLISGQAANILLQDQEGNVWAASASELHRFRVNRILGSGLKGLTLPIADKVPRPIIQSVSTDSATYPAEAELHLPPGSNRFRIDYTVPLLRAPERTRFELWLDGVDTDWQDAGNLRAMSYTNIAPGKYTFHLRAFNETAVAGEGEALMQLIVEPTIFQTAWFRLLCGLVMVVLAYFVYQYRKQRMARLLIERLELRSAERQRLAVELNDTVIQSMHGVLIFAEDVVAKYEGKPEVKDKLCKAIEYASSAIMEGRDQVQKLRQGCDDELVDMFDALIVREPQIVPVMVRQSGVSRDVHLVVKDELYAIGREALHIAIEHHVAASIIIQLRYSPKEMEMLISDDGVRAQVTTPSAADDAAHIALLAMCHRASQIGATCARENRPGRNLLRVTIRATLAYKQS